jgi:hypothetical protein
MPRTATASEVFDAMTADDRWLGFGYLGARRNALDTSDPEFCPPQPERVGQADELVLDHAHRHRWTEEQLFTWANSKNGRLYGDAMFGGTGSAVECYARAYEWGVLSLPRR